MGRPRFESSRDSAQFLRCGSESAAGTLVGAIRALLCLTATRCSRSSAARCRCYPARPGPATGHFWSRASGLIEWSSYGPTLNSRYPLVRPATAFLTVVTAKAAPASRCTAPASAGHNGRTTCSAWKANNAPTTRL